MKPLSRISIQQISQPRLISLDKIYPRLECTQKSTTNTTDIIIESKISARFAVYARGIPKIMF